MIQTLAAVSVAAPAAALDFPHLERLESGVVVRVFPPELILETMTARDAAGRLVFYPDGGGSYILIEDMDDPAIVNKGGGAFFPMRETPVLEALAAIDVDGRMLELEIDVYLLPLPRRYMLTSSASGRRIFLSPGTYPCGEEVTAWTATHEFGHCFQNRYMPLSDLDSWETYLRLRGIFGDPDFTESGAHRNRPSEIFAEDFRALFGGAAACYSGTIENPALVMPDEVPGLREFFVGLLPEVLVAAAASGPARIVSALNYPNPFNPVTTITARLGGDALGRPLDVRIYAADGTLVRTLFAGAAAGPEFSVAWDGRRDGGTEAVSGVYFYRIRSGGDSFTGKMLMLR